MSILITVLLCAGILFTSVAWFDTNGRPRDGTHRSKDACLVTLLLAAMIYSLSGGCVAATLGCTVLWPHAYMAATQIQEDTRVSFDILNILACSFLSLVLILINITWYEVRGSDIAQASIFSTTEQTYVAIQSPGLDIFLHVVFAILFSVVTYRAWSYVVARMTSRLPKNMSDPSYLIYVFLIEIISLAVTLTLVAPVHAAIFAHIGSNGDDVMSSAVLVLASVLALSLQVGNLIKKRRDEVSSDTKLLTINFVYASAGMLLVREPLSAISVLALLFIVVKS